MKPGVILEIEGSVWKGYKRTLFYYKNETRETRELAKNVTTAQRFLKASSVDHV